MEIKEQVPLAPLTTFGIGGPAHFFIRVRSVEELHGALDYAQGRGLKVLILGGGSNLLIDDTGFEGLVIKIEFRGVEEKNGLLVAGAGEEWDALVSRAVETGLWGIENLSGIPGTVGAAPVQNIGAYGAELAQMLEFVEVFDVSKRALVKLSRAECAFGYRSSVFKKNPGKFVIVRVGLRLDKKEKPNLSYVDLQGLQKTSLKEIREKVLEIRSKKFPNLALEGTAGSFFLNPILSKEQVENLSRRFPELPQFPTDEGIKVSLAWLLDRALGVKGMRVGRARLFERQPLVVVAERGVSSLDVRTLAEAVAARVQNELGITLEPEVRII